ncbi:uncharacterized protein LOC134843797 isoform X2 [Symsagittifera roscoffensis]|uniref:uncharacterized protein LOC134843797 isoform X2 n=1 Tax=Symsagittifera roscoffensis TaxID=84072 RepID=UPI00307B9A6B
MFFYSFRCTLFSFHLWTLLNIQGVESRLFFKLEDVTATTVNVSVTSDAITNETVANASWHVGNITCSLIHHPEACGELSHKTDDETYPPWFSYSGLTPGSVITFEIDGLFTSAGQNDISQLTIHLCTAPVAPDLSGVPYISNETSISILASDNPVTPSNNNGYLTHYGIKTDHNNQSAFRSTGTVAVNENLEIYNLGPGTEYKFQVYAINNRSECDNPELESNDATEYKACSIMPHVSETPVVLSKTSDWFCIKWNQAKSTVDYTGMVLALKQGNKTLESEQEYSVDRKQDTGLHCFPLSQTFNEEDVQVELALRKSDLHNCSYPVSNPTLFNFSLSVIDRLFSLTISSVCDSENCTITLTDDKLDTREEFTFIYTVTYQPYGDVERTGFFLGSDCNTTAVSCSYLLENLGFSSGFNFTLTVSVSLWNVSLPWTYEHKLYNHRPENGDDDAEPGDDDAQREGEIDIRVSEEHDEGLKPATIVAICFFLLLLIAVVSVYLLFGLRQPKNPTMRPGSHREATVHHVASLDEVYLQENEYEDALAGTSYGRGLNYENLAYTEDYETRTEETKPKLSFSDITPGNESNDDYNFQMRHENQIEDTGL